MTKITMYRTLPTSLLCLLLTGMTGCSIYGAKSAAQTPAAAEKTAYYLCGGCHGPEYVRVNFMSPKIIGQKQSYLAEKLRDYRDNKRIDPFMNGVSADLSDQEIESLAAYYANFEKHKN